MAAGWRRGDIARCDGTHRIFEWNRTLIPATRDETATGCSPSGIKAASPRRALFALLRPYISAAPFPSGLPKSYALISTNVRRRKRERDFHADRKYKRLPSRVTLSLLFLGLFRIRDDRPVVTAAAWRQISSWERDGETNGESSSRNLTSDGFYLRCSSTADFPRLLGDIPLSSARPRWRNATLEINEKLDFSRQCDTQLRE
jgi:hypothetical protein